jgi:hypothetical protein
MYGPSLITAADAIRAARAPETELDLLRRLHREDLAAARASRREARRAARPGARRLTRPAIAIWTFVAPRR